MSVLTSQARSRPRLSKRDIHGIVLLDKPLGLSSNRALQRVKGMLSARKAGHTGALDPLATGMLPICLGDATRFAQWLLETDKTYHVTATFGVRTATSDSEGAVVSERPVPELTPALLEAVLPAFRGPISQVPSMYSALKFQGKPLYEYARQGVTIDRPARAITIYAFRLLSIEGPTATFTVTCSKGTYIRTLIDDLGEALGCGAHVSQLHRSHVGGFVPEAMQSLAEMQALVDAGRRAELDATILPLSVCVSHLPTAAVTAATATLLGQGQVIAWESDLTAGTEVAIMAQQTDFIGVGVVDGSGGLVPKRLRRQDR